MNKSKQIGNDAEKFAADYLKMKGHIILERNFSCRFGEIDIISSYRHFVVFSEVKFRSSSSYGTPREFVTVSKQNRIRATAMLWLKKNKHVLLQPRFDVIEVTPCMNENKINIFENAF